MAVIPPTPADTKGKGKERAREPEESGSSTHLHIPPYSIGHPSIPSYPVQAHATPAPHVSSDADAHISENRPKSSGSPTESSGSSSPAAGNLSKKVLAILDHLFQQTEALVMEAADTTGFSADRVTKLLGKRLGIKMRGSGTTWNGYQNFFKAHMQQELQRIGAEEEYASASSAQKRGIVSRAHDAFKASFDGENEWVDVLKVWEELNVVSTGCIEQTYGSRESKFASVNREIEAIV